ncbi:hypothetical protein AAHC03_023004 [Spirometra sp. Aus1]
MCPFYEERENQSNPAAVNGDENSFMGDGLQSDESPSKFFLSVSTVAPELTANRSSSQRLVHSIIAIPLTKFAASAEFRNLNTDESPALDGISVSLSREHTENIA